MNSNSFRKVGETDSWNRDVSYEGLNNFFLTLAEGK